MSGMTAADLTLHHVGLVVDRIEARRGFYTDTLNYRAVSPVLHDPVQTAFVQFFAILGADHFLELVAPDGEGSKLQNACRKGLPLNHLCYACAEIEATLAELREAGCFVLQQPAPAVAFGGRRIAWLMSRDNLLLELVERGSGGWW